MSILKSTNSGFCGSIEGYLLERHYIQRNYPDNVWFFSTMDGHILDEDFCIRKVYSRFEKTKYIYFVNIYLTQQNDHIHSEAIKIKSIEHIRNIEKYWNMCMHVSLHYDKFGEHDRINQYAKEYIIDYGR